MKGCVMRAGLLAVALLLAACTTTPSSSESSEPPTPTTAAASEQPTEGGMTLEQCPRQDVERVTVLSLNLHAGRTKAGRLDLGRIASELRAWDADLVLLQEVDRGRRRSDEVDQTRWLARRLGLEAAYGPTDRSRLGSNGNGILSQWPITDVRLHDLPHAPGYFRRGLVRATIDVRGQQVDVFATHLDHASSRLRQAQARAVADAVRRSPRPVVLGADLNAEPGMPAVRALERVGLVDGWPVVGRDDGLTVPAAAPRRRIDYVLADESFAPVRSRVLISLVSDHRAVRTTYDLLPRDC